MFSSRVESISTLRSDQIKDKFQSLVQQILIRFDKIIRSYLMFNVSFWIVLMVQVILLAVFLPVLLKSALMALALALFVLTIFAYLVIREFVASQKILKIENLKQMFLEACTSSTGAPSSQAVACSLLAEELHRREYRYFTAPRLFKGMKPWFEKLSCKMHWEDIFHMQEALLTQGVMEKIQKVKREPSSLEAHAELAKAYILLAGLYIDPKKVRVKEEMRWIPPERTSDKMEKKFKEVSHRAIEEFKIIKEYAPNDPWVHEQLAFSYHDLGMPLDEIAEYENILVLKPQHVETLRKLGELYFQQGQNGKGLKIYEQLRRLNPAAAEEALANYGTYLTL